jgi:large subunit ribosomal protein L4e
MKTNVYNLEGERVKEIELPSVFSEEIRPDVIKRAGLVLQSAKRQRYGANPRAGMEYSAKLSKRRKDYRGSYGKGISRVPRKVMLRRGTQFVLTGAVVSGTVGGRKAHPPKSEKIFKIKINKKENKKGIRSAIAATIDKDYLIKKGFSSLDKVPLVVEGLEKLSKTSDAIKLFKTLGLENEIKRASKKTIRSGKGTMRGRKYKKVKGPLIVVSKKDSSDMACNNLAGFDISNVNSLNVDILAPGATPGRMIIWSLDSIKKLDKEKLFI